MNYKTFIYTDNQLKRKYSKDILDKYYYQLSLLYQNGFKLDANSIKEVEEQLLLYNYFENAEDLEELIKVTGKPTFYEFGKRIIAEELYDIIRESSFAISQDLSFSMEKFYAENNFFKIVELNKRLSELFNCKDLVVAGALKEIENVDDIIKRINSISDYSDKGIKITVWMSFKTLRVILYSCYIKLSKEASEEHKLAITSNINDELYGGAGGYNAMNNEIKAWNGTNVYDTKIIKNMPLNPTGLLKLKTLANTIIKDTKGAKIDDENEKLFKWLISWTKGYQTDDEKARRIVVNIMLNGTLELLKLKNNLSLIKNDKKNILREEYIKREFEAILNYCEIPKNYLL